MSEDDDSDTIAPFPKATIDRLTRRALAKLDEHDRLDGIALAEVWSGGIFAVQRHGVLLRFLGQRDGHPRESHGTRLQRLHRHRLIRLGSDFARGVTQVVLTPEGRERLDALDRRPR